MIPFPSAAAREPPIAPTIAPRTTPGSPKNIPPTIAPVTAPTTSPTTTFNNFLNHPFLNCDEYIGIAHSLSKNNGPPLFCTNSLFIVELLINDKEPVMRISINQVASKFFDCKF